MKNCDCEIVVFCPRQATFMRIVTEWKVFRPFVDFDHVGIVLRPFTEDEILLEVIYAKMSGIMYSILLGINHLLQDRNGKENEEYAINHHIITRG